jgi:integrase
LIDMVIADHARAGHPIAPATLIRIRATLRAALRAAVRHGLLVTNPASLVELPVHVRSHPVVWTDSRVAAWQATEERPLVAVWTAQHLSQFLAATRDHPLHPMWWLIACRGLRRGEACGLRWVNLDLSAGYMLVVEQLVEENGHVTVA